MALTPYQRAVVLAERRGISLTDAIFELERTEQDQKLYGNDVGAIVRAREERGEAMPVDSATIGAQLRAEYGNELRGRGPRPDYSLQTGEGLVGRALELSGDDAMLSDEVLERVSDITDRVVPPRPNRDSSWGETLKKAVQNLDDQIIGRGGGGIIASLPETMRELRGIVLPGTNLIAPNAPVTPFDEQIEAAGQGVFNRATREIERNAPDLDQSPGKQFAYDLVGAFSSLATAVGVTAATKNPQAGMAVLGAQAFGDRFGQSIAEGRSRDEAFMDGTVYGLAEMVGENKVLGSIMKPGGTLSRRVAAGAVGESLQEGLTSIIQNGYDVGILREDMTLGEFARAVLYDMGLGAVAGGGVATVSHPFTRRSPEEVGFDTGALMRPEGLSEAASVTPVTLTPEDQASPLPTERIAQGRARIEAAAGSKTANQILQANMAPEIGSRVEVIVGGEAKQGVIEDAFSREDGDGVKVKLDDGSTFDEYFDNIRDANVAIVPLERAERAFVDPAVATPDRDDEDRPSPRMTQDAAIRFVMRRLEGGGQRVVDSGGVTRYGISKNANPDVDVENLTEEQAVSLYRSRYWNKLGLDDSTPPDFALVAFDAAINHGVGAAQRMIEQSGGDTAKLLELRRQLYARLVRENPGRYAQYERGWENRLRTLEGALGGNLSTGETTEGAEPSKPNIGWIEEVMRDEGETAPTRAENAQVQEPDRLREKMGEVPAVIPAVAEAEPSAGRLWTLSQDDLQRLLADKQESNGAKLERAFGPEGAKRFKALDRMRNSSDPRRSDEGSRLFESEFGRLTPEQERLAYGVGESDAQVDDIKEIIQAHSDVRRGDDADWSSYMAAVAARKVRPSEFADVLAGRGSPTAQASFVRMQAAYANLKEEGVSANEIPQRMADALVARGWQPEQAAEVIGGFVEGLKEMAPPSQPSAPPVPRIEDQREALPAAPDVVAPGATEAVAEPALVEGPLNTSSVVSREKAADVTQAIIRPASNRPVAPNFITPASAVRFVKAIGGIRDTEGHALSSKGREIAKGKRLGGRGLNRYPGLINNKKGLSLDQAGEALWEAGYFGSPSTAPRPSVDDVIQILEQNRYRPDEVEQVVRARAEKEGGAERKRKAAEAREKLDAALKDEALKHFVPSIIAESDKRGIVELMLEPDAVTTDDPYTAAPEYFYRRGAEILDDLANETADDFYASDIPFEEPTREAEQREDEGDGREAAEGRRRPAREREDAAGSEATRADTGEAEQEVESRAGVGGTGDVTSPANVTATGPQQTDAFGERPEDQRKALERRADGRKRSSKAQKPPGSEGGLFDQPAVQTESDAIAQAKAALQTAMTALDQAVAPKAEPSPERRPSTAAAPPEPVVEPDRPKFSRVVPEESPVFYSALERAVEASPTKRAPASQWIATLAKTPGVKKEELEWTGVFDWLDAVEGPVERDALLQVIRDGGIKVEEVVLSSDNITEAERMELDDAAFEESMGAQPTQFADWSSDPSNDTYRELLITLPLGKGGNPSRAPATHWDTESVVAHARFMEKRDAEGKRVLFIEEIQSDWHQKGRDEGYERQLGADEVTRRVDALVEAEGVFLAAAARVENIVLGAGRGLPGNTGSESLEAAERLSHLGLYDANEIDGFEEADKALAAARLAYIEARQAASRSAVGSIPDAPFKSSWPALVLKRMIRYAADNGFERVAWTTGAEQNERYSLEKVVRRVTTKVQEDGRLFVFPTPDNEQVVNALRQHGDIAPGGATYLTREKANELFGAELTARMYAGEGTRTDSAGYVIFEGIDLRIGTSAMEQFYDRNLVNIANDILKKYGVKVGEVRFREIETYQDEEGDEAQRSKSQYNPGFPLTPALVEAARGGFPLFRRENGVIAPVDEETAARWRDKLQAEMKRLGIDDRILLEVVGKSEFGPGVAGAYFRETVTVALGVSPDPIFTASHEFMHALDGLGVFRPSEITAQQKAVLAKPELLADVRKRNPELGDAALMEEARADLYGQWRAKRYNAKGFVAKAFQRISDLIDIIRGAFMRQPTVGQVFRDIESGRIGRRQPGETDEVAFDQSKAKKILAGIVALSGTGGEVALHSAPTNIRTFVETVAGSQSQINESSLTGEDLQALKKAAQLAMREGDSLYYSHYGLERWVDFERWSSVYRRSQTDASYRMATTIGAARLVRDRDGNVHVIDTYDFNSNGPGRALLNNPSRLLDGEAVYPTSVLDALGYLAAPEGGGRVVDINLGPLSSQVTLAPYEKAVQEAPSNNRRIMFSIPNSPSINFGRGKFGERLDEWRTAMQDRMLPILRAQAAAEHIVGRPLAEEEQPYLAEELMTGRVGAQLEKLEQRYNSLFEALDEEKITADELESYLYARHAPERNASMAKINADLPNGSGMSDIEAAAIIKRVADSGKLDGMKRLAKHVDDILAMAVETRVEAGLMTREQADEWRGRWRHYVPLKGFAELPEVDERPNIGSGISVRGPESKRAFGRRSQADDIIAHSIMQAEEAVFRAEKNRVGQALYKLAEAAPDPDFWATNKVTMKKRINEETGLVETYAVHQLTGADAPYTVSLKIEGKERRVTFNARNPEARKAADAMRRLNEPQISSVVALLSRVNRFLSAVNTSLNPEFVITNAFRDLQTAAVNLAGLDVQGLEAATLRDWKKGLFAATKGAFGKEEGEWGKWWREFVDEGGRTFYNDMQTLDKLRRDVERRMDPTRRPNPTGLNLKPKQLALIAKEDLKVVLGFIDNVNTGIENAVRLSVYKNARELGLSKAKAASIAKNLTVNFNRRGAHGVMMNSLYLFYNASIQGSTRILLALKHRRVRQIVAGIVVAGAMQELLNMALSDEDDDGELIYDKLDEFEKQGNMIFMVKGPWGDYIKLPMPWGYRAFHSAGRNLVALARGKPVGQTTWNIARGFIESFNPVGGTNSVLNFLAPTLVDPAVDLTQNRDFANRPIMPEQSPFEPEKPMNQRYWANVGPQWKMVTDFLNSATGGDEVVPGTVDVSPEALEYLFSVVTGAAGAFLDRTAGLGAKIGGGMAGDPNVEITVNDVPLVRKLVGSKPAWYDRSAFYARLDHVEETVSRAKEYIGDVKGEVRDPEGLERYIGREEDVLSVERAAKAARKALRKSKKERGQLEARHEMGIVGDSEFKDGIRTLDGYDKQVMSEFNAVYLEFVEKPRGPSD